MLAYSYGRDAEAKKPFIIVHWTVLRISLLTLTPGMPKQEIRFCVSAWRSKEEGKKTGLLLGT
jgi:hypothetical protein